MAIGRKILGFLFTNRSIKWQFSFIIVLLLFVSLFTLGMTTYNTTKDEIYKNIETITEKQVEGLKLYADDVYASGDEEEITRFKETISSIVIGKEGFLFLLDDTGTFVLHPKAQGENWADEEFIQTILEKQSGFHRYISPKTNTYKIVSFQPIEGTDLILVASAFEDEFLDGLYHIQESTIYITAVAIAVSVVVACVVGIWFGASFNKFSGKMKKISNGDLTETIDTNLGNKELNQMGISFSAMVIKLQDILSVIHENSRNTSSMSQQLAHSAREVSQSTENLSTAVGELAAGGQTMSEAANDTKNASEQLTSTIRQITSISEQAKEDAMKATEAAVNGSTAAEQAKQKMDLINKNVQTSAALVDELGERIQEISKVIEVINDISAQTNLLALNAAIEAARAGEAGRGFAVVADEVRKLADGSQDATTKIEAMITDIIEQTKKAVHSMNEGRQEIDESAQVVNDSLRSLHLISEKIQTVAQEVQKINEHAQTQSGYAEKVEQSIVDVSSFAEEAAASTQQASASIEETSASTQLVAETAKALSSGAEKLEKTVNQFRIR